MEVIIMTFKKIIAMAAALCMTTAMFASCGDTTEDSSSSAAADSAAASTADDAASTADSTATDDSAAATDDSVSADSAAATDSDKYIDETTGLECFIPSADYTPVTEFEGYDSFLMFGDANWLWGNWNGQGYEGEASYGVDADVTGDGEYTVSITADSIGHEDDEGMNENIAWDGEYVLPATGTVVFCVDITGICDGTTDSKGEALKKNKLKEGDDAGVNKSTMGKYTGQELKVTVTSIKADGEEIPFDESKIVYGNIEDNNNCYRIEIYNEYGDTKKDPPIDISSIQFAKELSVTYTIEGLSE
jgi:hypothetical protein